MAKLKVDKRGLIRGVTSDGSNPIDNIGEMGDDSLAGNAEVIEITVKGKDGKTDQLIHADNGDGFPTDQALLDSMEMYGGTSHQNPKVICDFGIGYKKACLNLGDRFLVISRGSDGNVRGMTIDRDLLDLDEYFYGPLEEPPPGIDYKKLWKKYAVPDAATGTIFIIRRLKLRAYRTQTSFVKALKDKGTLRCRYYEFLQNGGTIKVNSALLESYDPTRRNEEGTVELLPEKSVQIPECDNVQFDIVMTELTPAETKNDGVRRANLYVNLNGTTFASSENWLETHCSNKSWANRLRPMITFHSKDEMLKVLQFTPDKRRIEVVDDTFPEHLNELLKGPKTTHISQRKDEADNQKAADDAALRVAEDSQWLQRKIGKLVTAPGVAKKVHQSITAFSPGAGFKTVQEAGRITPCGKLEFNEGWEPIAKLICSTKKEERSVARALITSQVVGDELAATGNELTMQQSLQYLRNLVQP